MNRKLLCGLILTIALMLCLPFCAQAATVVSSGECGVNGDNIIWQIDSDGVVTFKGSGDMANCDGNEEMEEALFDGEKIIIEDGITSIGYNSVSHVFSLGDVDLVIPPSVTKIDDSLDDFNVHISDLTKWCAIDFHIDTWRTDSKLYLNGKSVENLTIPSGVKKIKTHAFSGFLNIKTVSFPTSLTEIGNSAFEYCEGLTNVYFSDNIEILGDHAFYGCTSLQNFTLPKNLKGLGGLAFCDCDSLTSVTLPKSLGEGYGDSYSAFWDCGNLKTVIAEDGLRYLALDMFDDCPNITDVNIPASVVKISGNIGGSSKERPVNIRITDLNAWFEIESSGDIADYGELYVNGVRQTKLTVPEGIKKIYGGTFGGLKSITSIQMPDSIIEIASSAFLNCAGLTEIRIPKFVKELEYGTFYNCSNLQKITFSENLTTIGELAFAYCNGLKRITLPDSVVYLADEAFFGCENLETVYLPSGLEYMGSWVFAHCAKLTSVTLPMEIHKIKMGTFTDCTSLSRIVIPENIRSIGTEAFENCSSLSSVTFEGEMGLLEGRSFSGCTALTGIEIPASVYSIRSKAFSGCSSLSSVKFLGAAPNIAEDAFENVTATISYSANSSSWTSAMRQNYGGTLTWSSYNGSGSGAVQVGGICGPALTWALSANGTLTISGTGYMDDFENSWSMTSLAPWNDYASKITTVKFDGRVLNVGGYAFYNCTNLKSVDLGESIQSIGHYSFYGCSSLTSIQLKGGLHTIDQYAFAGCTGLTSIEFPQTISKIGKAAFEGCTGFRSFVWPATVDMIPEFALRDCTGLKSITIPEGVKYTQYQCFKGCTGLTSVAFPDSMIAIGGSSFEACTSLSSVDLGDGLKNADGFPACTALKTLEFPKSLETIDGYMFTSLDYPEVTEMTLKFHGDLPEFEMSWANGFSGMDLTIYYPAGNTTWTNAVRSNEFGGGKVKWISFVGSNTPISNCEISLDTAAFIYDGTAKKPGVTVIYGYTALKQGTHYSVSYSSNTNAGKAQATISGLGDFTGTVIREFDIAPADPTLSFAAASVTKKVGDSAFSNKLTATTDGVVTYTSGDPAVATVNSSTGAVTIKKKGSTIITATAAAGTNYRSGSASYALTIEDAAASGSVSLESLTYSFSNSSAAFGYSKSYQIPLERFQMFYPDTQAKMYYRNQGTWGGNCFGLATTSSMMNVSGSGLSLSDFGKSKVSDLTISTRNSAEGMTARDIIEAMQISQSLASYSNSIRAYRNNLSAICAAVSAGEKAGQPVAIAVYGPGGGHAIVGYKIKKINDRQSRMYVYDCNFPRQERYVTLYTSGGNYTGWYYNLNDCYDWGSSYEGCAISCVPYSTYQSIWQSRSGGSKNTNTLFVNSENFEICDYAGNVLATMENGVFSSSSSNIWEHIPLTGAGSDMNVIYLPTDVYEIINYEDSMLEADMVNRHQSSSVSTDADSVIFAVVDADESNLVYVDAEAGESYNVSMSSELSCAEGFEELEFSGFGDNGTVQLGLQSGSLYMTNCVGVSLWVNGQNLGSAEEEFQRNIAAYDIELEYVACGYDGKLKKPVVTVSNGGYMLKEDIDFVVKYDNNLDVGTATVAVYGIGSYSGSALLYFDILDGSDASCEEGHFWNSGEYTQDAVNPHNGIMTYTCMVCGATVEEIVYGYEYNLIESYEEFVTVSLTNNLDTAIKGKLCVVVYDADGNIIAFNIQSVNLNAGYTRRMTVDNMSSRTPAKVKAFVLDGDSYAPMSAAWSQIL